MPKGLFAAHKKLILVSVSSIFIGCLVLYFLAIVFNGGGKKEMQGVVVDYEFLSGKKAPGLKVKYLLIPDLRLTIYFSNGVHILDKQECKGDISKCERIELPNKLVYELKEYRRLIDDEEKLKNKMLAEGEVEKILRP